MDGPRRGLVDHWLQPIREVRHPPQRALPRQNLPFSIASASEFRRRDLARSTAVV